MASRLLSRGGRKPSFNIELHMCSFHALKQHDLRPGALYLCLHWILSQLRIIPGSTESLVIKSPLAATLKKTWNQSRCSSSKIVGVCGIYLTTSVAETLHGRAPPPGIVAITCKFVNNTLPLWFSWLTLEVFELVVMGDICSWLYPS